MSCTLAAVVSSEWMRPPSPSTPTCTYLFAGLQLHAVVPLVAFLGLLHLRIPLPLSILGAAIMVASTIVHGFIAIPLPLRCASTASITAHPVRSAPADAGTPGSWSHPGPGR